MITLLDLWGDFISGFIMGASIATIAYCMARPD